MPVPQETSCVPVSFPHLQAEECFVVEGDFMTSGTTLFAGDYMRFPAGSFHGATRTENGCVLLITSEVDHH